MARINIQYIKRDLEKAVPQFRNLSKGAAISKLNGAKNELLRDLDEHQVTKELEGDPLAQGKILTEGNLFSFFGFNEGEDVTSELKEVLKDQIVLAPNPRLDIKSKSFNFVYVVEEPSKKELEIATPMPEWTNGSWLTRVEKGLKGLEAFMAGSFRNSRSGGGIQIPHNIRSDSFNGVSYLTEMLKKFRKRISS